MEWATSSKVSNLGCLELAIALSVVSLASVKEADFEFWAPTFTMLKLETPMVEFVSMATFKVSMLVTMVVAEVMPEEEKATCIKESDLDLFLQAIVSWEVPLTFAVATACFMESITMLMVTILSMADLTM